MLRRLSKPIRKIVQWQLAATATLTAVAAMLAGREGAVSAAAGGCISVFAGLIAAFVASRGKAKSAGGVVIGALMAEGIRLGLAVLLLWLVLMNYPGAVVAALIGSFVATMLIFAMAFFVREY
jgi:F0F1-type ATP synthase assembly protein I